MGRSELNGSYGRIENYNAAKQRFAVHVPVDGSSMLLKASSLCYIPDPMRQVCPCCHVGDAKSMFGSCLFCDASSSARILKLSEAEPSNPFFTLYRNSCPQAISSASKLPVSRSDLPNSPSTAP